MYSKFDESEYYGVTEASEARDRRQAEELFEDAQREEREREMSFIEYRACNDACFETGNHHAACETSGAPVLTAWEADCAELDRIAIAHPVAAAVNGWARALGLREVA